MRTGVQPSEILKLHEHVQQADGWHVDASVNSPPLCLPRSKLVMLLTANTMQVKTSSSNAHALLMEVAGSCAEAADVYDAARYNLQLKVKSLLALCTAQYGTDGYNAAMDMLREHCPKQANEVFSMGILDIE